jgi:hypothetical protein
MNASDDPWAAPASFEQGEPAAAEPPASAAQHVGEEPDPWASTSAPHREDTGRRPPDYVIVLAISPEMRERARHAGTARTSSRRSAGRKTTEPGLDPRQADREAEP